MCVTSLMALVVEKWTARTRCIRYCSRAESLIEARHPPPCAGAQTARPKLGSLKPGAACVPRHTFGDIDAAVKWQSKAVELAPEIQAGELSSRLEQYRAGKRQIED